MSRLLVQKRHNVQCIIWRFAFVYVFIILAVAVVVGDTDGVSVALPVVWSGPTFARVS